ncbi:MAG: DUF4910 domain-containing protein [Bacteroidia bacterium]|nr:DUF4910 domain-containing protein [Bacteroidia bacterium]
MLNRILLIFAFGLFFSCGQESKKEEEVSTRVVNVPLFNGDSAYFFVEKQVKFGPRVPNTTSHQAAGNYFVDQFNKYGAVVIEQKFEAVSFDGQRLSLRNIIASFNPAQQKRILLAAHWDTRPFADKDEVKPDAPFDGADDGASGVGVLLEVARQLSKQAPTVGVDIILFDGEDWGEKNSMSNQINLPEGLQSWWCLGSQYWSKNKHKKNYSAYYGILLDMVGSKRAHFYREGLSLEFAPAIVAKVWNTAARIGYSDYFVKQNSGEITDDHQFVNHVAKIPMIDIVHYHPVLGYFGDYHHTQKDNLDLISKETLQAVGATITNVIYYEE